MESSIQIEKTAAAWLARRDGGNWTDADQATLEEWLQASTAHRVAFVRLEFVWQQALRLRVLGAGEQPSSLESPSSRRLPPFVLRRRAQQAEALANQAHDVRASKSRVRLWALAASVVLVAGVLAWTTHVMMPRASYSTAVGGLASVPISDGSKVMLNTNSEIRVALTDSERRVNLEQGEAFFQVAKDPSRPFVVIAGNERVVAVGTQFAVRRDALGVRVVVTEGRVRVEPSGGASARVPPAELGAGGVAQSGGEGVLIQQRPVQEVEDFLSWRRGYLVFRDTTLTDAVAEFNRYTTSKIVIEDDEVGALRIGGNFRSDNVEAFLRLLHEGFDIEVEKRDERLVLKRH